MQQQIQVIPSYSLEPTKLTLFNRVYKASDYDKNGNRKTKTKRISADGSTSTHTTASIVRSSHNLVLSPNAYRTLRKRISWLYYLSKSRHRKTYSGKDIYNFKICFLTLTLSSRQKHTTAEVTATMFNQFMTEIRQRTGMQNYVWRMEYQANGNVHYHIVTDTYIDYYFALSIWNRIQETKGYIEPYRAKHEAMSLQDYNQTYNKFNTRDFSIVAKQYAKGKKNKWSQPNSVDVKSVISKKAIGAYISKYFGKNEDGKVLNNDYDTAENIANIRLWFCSRSLSKVNNIVDFVDAGAIDIVNLVKCAKDIRKYIAQYATMLYFEITNLPHYCRKVLEPLMRNHAYSTGYQPSS